MFGKHRVHGRSVMNQVKTSRLPGFPMVSKAVAYLGTGWLEPGYPGERRYRPRSNPEFWGIHRSGAPEFFSDQSSRS